MSLMEPLVWLVVLIPITIVAGFLLVQRGRRAGGVIAAKKRRRRR
jgi:hypothetical protein